MSDAGSLLVVIGSVVFLVGAGVGVPTVFVTRDSDERARLLTRHRTRWQLAQPFYALGPALAAVGVGVSGLDAGGAGGFFGGLAAMTMLLGAGTWSYSCWLRAADPVRFAVGLQPGWPFHFYVIATLVGLASLGLALIVEDVAAWTGWLVVTADLVLGVAYSITGDLPPFVFYLLLIVVAVVL